MMLSANNAWRERNPRPTMNFIQKNWKGILVCLVMAVPCWLLGQRFPIVGGPVFGILAGMIVTLLWHDKSAAQPGISFVSKKVLQYAVILLGFGMNLSVIWQTGKQSLPIIVVTITTSLVVAWLLHRLLLQIGRSSLSFELPLSFEQAAAYRKANGQYVRKNQWRDTTVRVFIDLD